MSWWHHKCCAAAPTCDCECEHCAAATKAPCCWKVVIADIVADGCGACTNLNKTYYLEQDPDNSCHWFDTWFTAICGISAISLVVTENTITVTLGDNVWSKDFGADPNCCAEHELPNTATAADCDATSSTATISRATPVTRCASPVGCPGWPAAFVVDLGAGGWTNKILGMTPYPTGDPCPFGSGTLPWVQSCCETIAGEYTLAQSYSGCTAADYSHICGCETGGYGGCGYGWCYPTALLCDVTNCFVNCCNGYPPCDQYFEIGMALCTTGGGAGKVWLGLMINSWEGNAAGPYPGSPNPCRTATAFYCSARVVGSVNTVSFDDFKDAQGRVALILESQSADLCNGALPGSLYLTEAPP